MSTLRPTYYVLSLPPALLDLAAKLSAASDEGWGAAYPGLALIVPIYASFVLGCSGVGSSGLRAERSPRRRFRPSIGKT